MIDLGIPIDWRIGAAIAAVVFAGVAKGVTGMGLPVAGVPILVALYGDLRLVLLATILATATSDIPMLWKYRDRWRDARMLLGFFALAFVGIFIGNQILHVVKTSILAGGLALLVIVFITISWLGRMPRMSQTLATRLAPVIGLLSGIVQGSVGASGPIPTIYLVSAQLPRESFLFALSAIFFVNDWAQFTALHVHGEGGGGIAILSVAVTVLAFAGLAAGMWLQSRIDDAVFRRGVLGMLAIAAIALIARAVRGG